MTVTEHHSVQLRAALMVSQLCYSSMKTNPSLSNWTVNTIKEKEERLVLLELQNVLVSSSCKPGEHPVRMLQLQCKIQHMCSGRTNLKKVHVNVKMRKSQSEQEFKLLVTEKTVLSFWVCSGADFHLSACSLKMFVKHISGLSLVCDLVCSWIIAD